MKIKNIINGGHQQFADKIINYNSNLSDTDRKLIELIESDSRNNVDKQQLVKSIEELKSPNTSQEAKESSKGFLKRIFDAGISEVTRGAVRALIEHGPNYLDFL